MSIGIVESRNRCRPFHRQIRRRRCGLAWAYSQDSKWSDVRGPADVKPLKSTIRPTHAAHLRCRKQHPTPSSWLLPASSRNLSAKRLRDLTLITSRKPTRSKEPDSYGLEPPGPLGVIVIPGAPTRR